MTWLAAVDYRQGTRHRARQLPCHDFGIVTKPTRSSVIGALADGDPKARLSHIGAQIAAKTAAKALEESLQEGVIPEESELRPVLHRVRIVLDREAKSRDCDTSDLATTLTTFVLTPEKIVAMQIGDGFLIAASPSRPYHSIAGSNAKRNFVTDDDAEDGVEIAIDDGPVSFVAAGSNGLKTLSIRSEDGRPHASFLRPLNRYISAAESDDEIHLGIREFLRSERLAEAVDDDMSLLLCGWRSEPGWETRAV